MVVPYLINSKLHGTGITDAAFCVRETSVTGF